MKICEITDKNASWLALNNLPVSINEEYADAVSIVKLMISTGSPSRNRGLIPLVTSFEDTLSKIISLPFPNPRDIDIKELKSTAKNMLLTLAELKSKVRL